MSEIKHTVGPWGLSSQSPTIIKQYDSLGETNVIVGSASAYSGSPFFPSDDEAHLNARLMAAAPDLLEALKYARRMVKASECDIAFINAAIAKATGSQS
jgi:hypothetical protein